MNEKKNNFKKYLLKCYQGNHKSAGITLIALVISIIVLIILAGVAINTLINNGIIDKAKTATQEYKNAQDYEETQIAKYTNDINSYVSGNRDYTLISYSADEQDTGLKWIDGKSIYQKTFLGNTGDNGKGTITHNLSIDKAINIQGFVMQPDGNNHNYVPLQFTNGKATYMFGVYTASTEIRFDVSSGYYNMDAYITIQYTKK